MEKLVDVVIIGAGICGLSAARRLREGGKSVLLLEKARGPGGRMATRRMDVSGRGPELVQARFDHGAQFFTVRDERFRRIVEEMLTEGVVNEWCRGFPKHAQDVVARHGHPRYRGATGMNAPTKFLARDQDVRLNHRVKHVVYEDHRWTVHCENQTRFYGKALLTTAPVPQSLAVLDASATVIPEATRRALEKIEYDPCFVAMVVLTGPSNLPEPGALQAAGEPIDFIADNARKGISPVTAVTIHGGPNFSRGHLDDDPTVVARLLLDAAGDLPGRESATSATSVTGHRWLYAKPCVSHPERFLSVSTPGPLVFAGDAFGEARVEGAFLSGLAAAEQLL